MIKTKIVLGLVCLSYIVFGQNIPKEYFDKIKKADSLYDTKNFVQSALMYSNAFKVNDWKGAPNDRYNAACSWALANVPDSAFFNLERVASKSNYSDYNHISSDEDLNSLFNDKRWKPLLILIKQNKEKAEEKFNKPLIAILDIVYFEDQSHRNKIGEIEKKFGISSKEIKNHWKNIHIKDSINIIKVTEIIDQYGWLGADVIGNQGNSALFLVIQHANQKTQEKYIPIIRDAVKKGNALSSNLALLEDRLALKQDKKQIYGSQIGRNPDTNTHFVMPLEDPDNVDKRRAEVGLGLLKDYVFKWQIIWDIQQYKKDLPNLKNYFTTNKN